MPQRPDAATAHQETERLLASIASLLIEVDQDGLVTRWNSAAESTFGIEAAAAIGRRFVDCPFGWVEPDVPGRILQPRESPARLENVRYRDAGGRERFVTLTVTDLQGEIGWAHGFVVLGADVTERRILEEQLRQAQKMEGIGQLAAGIAHEINTPTQYVGDNVHFLQDAFTGLGGLFASVRRLRAAATSGSSDAELRAEIAELDRQAEAADLDYLCEEVPKAIDQTIEGVRRVSRIVKAMKEFSHPQRETMVAIDLNRAIETTMVVAQNELKYVADATTDFDPDLPLVSCLPGDINQVVLNLLVNAAHAIGDAASAGTPRGRITVSTRRGHGHVEIRVADSGTGIPEHARAHVFEPFYTTKEVGRGTGQGLAHAHATIVKKHGGQIDFETAMGRGTTFIVRLPLTGAPASGEGAAPW
jgi:PAS domain S-box-containing protein